MKGVEIPNTAIHISINKIAFINLSNIRFTKIYIPEHGIVDAKPDHLKILGKYPFLPNISKQ